MPILSKDIFTHLEKNYENIDTISDTNPYTDITDSICNSVYSNNKCWEQDLTHTEFLNKLTKEQRIYFSLVNFESQVNNGCVYQFLFNYPELSLIALDAMKILKMERLSKDYSNVLNEYFGKFKDIQELKARFNNANSDWDKRWNAFADGYKELKTAKVIDDYFYDKGFKQEFQNDMYNFAKNNERKLYQFEK